MPHTNNNNTEPPRGKRGREPMNPINPTASQEEHETALFLLMLSASKPKFSHPCQICGKTFPSHQALGGHFGSHLRLSKPNPTSKISSNKNLGEEKKHQCLHCSKEFASGQALGGHQRVHSNQRSAADDGDVKKKRKKKRKKKEQKEKLITSLCLDLNLPPPSQPFSPNEDEGFCKLGLSPVSPLMPCHYI